ncbi:hypothetical protein E4U31_000529 [Claviceps sp. LM219 group G6]|nr:hypothetical protein E4U31_000529 [Claviceps sp. LM219 group G6]
MFNDQQKLVTFERSKYPARLESRLRERRKKPKIVDSEKSLKHRQEEALTGPVEFLIKELEHITNL